MTELIVIPLLLTAAVYGLQRLNPEWNYLYGAAFFALLPAGALAEDGLAQAVAGYSLGMGLLILITGIAVAVERVVTGSWQKPQV